MKLCDIVQFYSPLGGGVRRYVEDKMRLLSLREDIQHIVIIPSDRNEIEIRGHTTFYHVNAIRMVGSNSYRLLRERNHILSILDRERPDVIEVDNPYFSAWTALEGGRRLGVPVAAFYHSDFPRALGRTLRRFTGSAIETMLSAPFKRYIVNLYNRMDATIVASRRMESVLGECGIERLRRIPLGTDVNRFRPNPDAPRLRQNLGLGDDDMLILFVGRLAREKNIFAMMDMLEILNRGKDGGCYRLLLVGDGELRRGVQKRLHRLPNLIWEKYCTSPEELTRYYTAADVFLHAGNYETFGITSLEAQACGTRVIAVEGGGLEDTLEGESPLILSASSSPEDLAEAVRKAHRLENSQSPEERRQRIVDHFSLEKTVERLLDLYQELIDQKSNSIDPTDSTTSTIHEHNHSTVHVR